MIVCLSFPPGLSQPNLHLTPVDGRRVARANDLSPSTRVICVQIAGTANEGFYLGRLRIPQMSFSQCFTSSELIAAGGRV